MKKKSLKKGILLHFFLMLFMQFPLFSDSSTIIPPIQNYPQAPSAPPVTSGGGYPVDVTGFSGSAADAMNYIVNRLQDIQNILRDNDEHVQHIDQMISGTKQLSQQLASLASIENYENAVSQVHVPQNPYNDPNSSSNFLNTSITQSQCLNGMLTQLPYGLQFDGNNFNGMGLGYVGNIMGLSGLPIGLDAFPPFMLTSLSPQQFAVGTSLAQQFMGGSNLGTMVGGLGYMAMNFFPMYMGSNPLFSNIGGLMSLSGPLSWGILGNQISSTNGLNGQINLGSVLPSILGNAMVLGSNALIRSSSPNDPLYQSVLWGGNALQQLLFWMNSSSLNGLYSPVNGINQSNTYGLSPNLSEIYSAGAFGAVEDYLIRSNLRKQSNFLYQFSKKYEKQIIQFTLSTKPGEPVIFFASNRFDKIVFPYASLLSIRSAQPTDSEGSIEISHRKENNLENVQVLPVQLLNPSWGSGTLVTGISPQSYQSYMILIQANTARLQQNVAIERLDVQLYQDTVNIIQKLTQLQTDIKSLREQCQQNYLLAIPQISQLEVMVTNQLNNQQQFLEKLKNNIENYRQTRYQLLLDRLHVIDMMKEKAALEAGQAASHYLNEIQSQIPSPGET
ncbi:hypothetical protein A7Q09_07735 [Methylacidiphilum sp. Yel]|uniref:hypothetical protein n=1 Tax=Methylacidiphilum sp. Yel TaxID=1847730 RepID=UPI00106CA279|nr:hypothetical protein [Methylacidiphilum sp. Yel]TFE67989.1 hypothetical protein A7Q09_07735 [Methylacidiphilum sp. Yel]